MYHIVGNEHHCIIHIVVYTICYVVESVQSCIISLMMYVDASCSWKCTLVHQSYSGVPTPIFMWLKVYSHAS